MFNLPLDKTSVTASFGLGWSLVSVNPFVISCSKPELPLLHQYQNDASLLSMKTDPLVGKVWL